MHRFIAAQYSATAEPWYESWFDSPHYYTLYARRDLREAAAFIDRLVNQLPLGPGATVLDLGCGNGRHARQLAAHGCRVLGVDLSSSAIEAAKQHETHSLWFRRQDMRLPLGVGGFDTVFNLFTSFGYFEDAADDLAVVENISRALKPNGWLVLDYLNVHVAERDLRLSEVLEHDGMMFQINRWADETHLFKRIEIFAGGTSQVFVERVAKLALADFQFLFELCGFRIEATYGDYRLAPFEPRSSPRLVMIARKSSLDVQPDLAAGPRPTDATQRLRCDPKVRGKHGLRNAGRDGRIKTEELAVSLLR
jgi:SAM-dependent methyltransferase